MAGVKLPQNEDMTHFAGTDISEQVLAPHAEALEKFSAILADGLINPEDPDGFTKIISAAVDFYGVKLDDIAKHCKVDRSTVSRWASGESRPSLMMRPLIVNWIKNHIDDEVETLRQHRVAM